LFRDLTLARADGSFRTLLARLSRIDVLLIDDCAMAPLVEAERRDFWEICCQFSYFIRLAVLVTRSFIGIYQDPGSAVLILYRENFSYIVRLGRGGIADLVHQKPNVSGVFRSACLMK
jgi:hypothetical protein